VRWIERRNTEQETMEREEKDQLGTHGASQKNKKKNKKRASHNQPFRTPCTITIARPGSRERHLDIIIIKTTWAYGLSTQLRFADQPTIPHRHLALPAPSFIQRLLARHNGIILHEGLK
jgi:protocatechuate 3,4-dioxygenase beta subunit